MNSTNYEHLYEALAALSIDPYSGDDEDWKKWKKGLKASLGTIMMTEFIDDPAAHSCNEKLAWAVHHAISKALQEGTCKHLCNDCAIDENPYLLCKALCDDKDNATNKAIMLFNEFIKFNNLECRDKEFNSYYNSAKKSLSTLKKEKILPAQVITSGLIMSHCHDMEFLDRFWTDLAKNPDQDFEMVLSDMKAAAQAHKHSTAHNQATVCCQTSTTPKSKIQSNNYHEAPPKPWYVPPILNGWTSVLGKDTIKFLKKWKSFANSNNMATPPKIEQSAGKPKIQQRENSKPPSSKQAWWKAWTQS